MIEYIIGFILLGYVLLILVGLGFVTYGIFNLSNATVPVEQQNAVLVDYVKGKPITPSSTDATGKTITYGYTDAMKTAELAAIPTVTKDVSTGKIIYELGYNETVVGKITVVSLWIFITIGFVALVFNLM